LFLAFILLGSGLLRLYGGADLFFFWHVDAEHFGLASKADAVKFALSQAAGRAFYFGISDNGQKRLRE